MKKVLLIICMLFLTACAPKIETVYQTVYPNLPKLESPQTLSLNVCQFIMPETDKNIFVGYDELNYKCYLKNQEIHREQRLLYEKFIDQINKERESWTNLNLSTEIKK